LFLPELITDFRGGLKIGRLFSLFNYHIPLQIVMLKADLGFILCALASLREYLQKKHRNPAKLEK